MFKNVQKIINKHGEIDNYIESKTIIVKIEYEIDGIKINNKYKVCPICNSLIVIDEDRWEKHKKVEIDLGVDSIESIQRARKRFLNSLKEEENADNNK